MAYPESLHPYLPSTDDTQTWTGDAGTKFLLVTFDARGELFNGLDWLYVTNADGFAAGYLDGYTPHQSRFTGTLSAGKTVIIPGNTLKVRLTSVSYSSGYWGYAVTDIQEFTTYPPSSPDYCPLVNGNFDFIITGSSRQDFIGPFEFGSSLYIVIQGEPTDARGTRVAGVFKSTDGGATWSIQDLSHAPAWSAEGIVSDGSRYLWMGWRDASDGTVGMVKFDTTTDTFGPPTYGPTCTQFNFIKLIDSSTARLFYTTPVPGANGLYSIVYNGSWGAPITVTASSPVYLQVCMDPAGTSHVIYYQDPYPSRKYYYVQVAADGTVGTPILFKTVVASGDTGEPYAWGNPAIAGTRMLFPYSALDDTMGRRPSWLWVDPYTDSAPTLTLGAFTDSESTGATELCAVAVGTTMYLWAQESAIVGWLPEHYDRLVYYSDDGDGSGWSAATVFHDENAHPVIYYPGNTTQEMWNLSVARLSGDKWGVTNSFYVYHPNGDGYIYGAFGYYVEQNPVFTASLRPEGALSIFALAPSRAACVLTPRPTGTPLLMMLGEPKEKKGS